MLNNISWQGYWTSLALSCTAYYLWVCLKYFKADLLKFGAGKDKEGTVSFPPPRNETTVSEIFPSTGEDYKISLTEDIAPNEHEYAAYSLMDEVNAYLQEAKRTKCIREELVFALHTIFKKYPFLAATSWADAVTNFLVAECKQVCSVHLSEEELQQVWNGG